MLMRSVRRCANCSRKLSSFPQPQASEKTAGEEGRVIRERALQEYQIAKTLSTSIPSSISEKSISDLLEFDTIGGRLRHLIFLGKNERKRQRDQDKKRRRENWETKTSMWDNTIFRRVSDSTIDKAFESHSISPVVSQRPTVVLDCSFLPFMNPLLRNLTLSQIKECFALNRLSRYPCRLIFSDLPIRAPWFENSLKSHLQFMSPSQDGISCQSLAAECSEKPMTDLVPPEKLVYLSPDARNHLRKLDASRVYVIGAIVDKAGFPIPNATKNKASQLGIDSAALPLTRYLKWGEGGKALCLQHVLGTLLDVFEYQNWPAALRSHIPERKLTTHKANPKRTAQISRIRNLGQELKLKVIEKLNEPDALHNQ